MATTLQSAIDLRRIWGGFQAARVLITAVNLRVFDYLLKPKSAAEAARRTKADPRAMEALLNGLTGMGLLKKRALKYSNTPPVSRLLVTGRPLYQGDIVKHIDNAWHNWSNLDRVVKTGKPGRKGRDHESFILGMHNLSVFRAKGFLNAISMRGVKTALDLGGGPGTYAMELVKKGIDTTLFDLPETITVAKKLARKNNVTGIRYAAGDFIRDDIGSGYDLVIISQIFHAFDEDECLDILRKAKRALNPGGRVAVQEFLVSSDGTEPVHSALFSIHMLLATPGGRCYSPPEIKAWMRRLGFKQPKEKRLQENTVLVMASV